MISSDKTNYLVPSLSSTTRWQTKIFAIQSLDQLLIVCEQSPFSHLHFDAQIDSNEDYLVFHLKALITLAVCASRSTSDQLRADGLTLLKHIILRFSPKRKLLMEMSNENLLHAYQAQICTALRPSFSSNSSAHLTAQACDVCSTWLSTGIGPDLRDLRCAHQLLISSLRKLLSAQSSPDEHVTVENLAVLKLWADVYNLLTRRRNEQKDHSYTTFFNLLQAEFDLIIHHWLAAVADYAVVVLPEDYGGAKSIVRDGNFYSVPVNEERLKRLYQTTGFALIQAVTHWLKEHNYDLELSKSSTYNRQDAFLTKFFSLTLSNSHRIVPEKKENLFHVLLGCCVQTLSTQIPEPTDEVFEAILSALSNLIQSNMAIDQITIHISIEILRVLQR